MQQRLIQSEVERENERLRAQLAQLQKRPVEREQAALKHHPTPAIVYRIERARDGTVRFLEISEGCEAIYGLTPRQVMEDISAVRAMTHPDDRDRFLACLKESAETLKWFSTEYRIINTRGEAKWIRVNSIPSRGPNGSIVWDGIMSDITDCKAAERDFRLSEDCSDDQVRPLILLTDAGLALNAALSLKEKMEVAAGHARRITSSHHSVALLTGGRLWKDGIGSVSFSDEYAEHPETDEPPDVAGIYRLVKDTRQPIRLTDADLKVHPAGREFGPSGERSSCLLAVPILDREGAVSGLIQVCDKLEGEFSKLDELYLTQLSRLVSLEVELTKTRQELEERVRSRTADLVAEQKILRRLLTLQEKERKQISLDIHDGFVQYVVAAQMFLETLGVRMTKNGEETPPELNQVRELIDHALIEGRHMISELHPGLIGERGMVEAIKRLIAEEKRKGLKVRLRSTLPLDSVDPTFEHAVFRIVQEALTNVRLHSQTDCATVRLSQHNDMLRIVVRDQGVGFSLDQVPQGRFGLRGIRERAELFSGQARVRSQPGRGTMLVLEIPMMRERSS